MSDQVSCDDCVANVRHYCDGIIQKNWARYTGDAAALPKVPDNGQFWTYQECKRSTKKIMLLNLDGKCKSYSKLKSTT